MAHTEVRCLGKPTWVRVFQAIFLLHWASGFVFLKIGLRYADRLTFLALRYACIVGLLGLPSLWVRPTHPARLRVWLHLEMVGLLPQAGYFSFTYSSLKAGLSAGVIALITSQQPILGGLLAPVIAGERVGPLRWAGLALGVAGAVMVIISQSTIQIASPVALSFSVEVLLSLTGSTTVGKAIWHRCPPPNRKSGAILGGSAGHGTLGVCTRTHAYSVDRRPVRVTCVSGDRKLTRRNFLAACDVPPR